MERGWDELLTPHALPMTEHERKMKKKDEKNYLTIKEGLYERDFT